MFTVDQEYVFTGSYACFHFQYAMEKNEVGYFILGKFLQYKDVYLHGDILLDAKAVFENGTIDCGHYDKVVLSK